MDMTVGFDLGAKDGKGTGLSSWGQRLYNR
jgi:hypothetical protein